MYSFEIFIVLLLFLLPYSLADKFFLHKVRTIETHVSVQCYGRFGILRSELPKIQIFWFVTP